MDGCGSTSFLSRATPGQRIEAMVPTLDDYEPPEIREQIYAALAQLTPESRAVIVLKEIEDLQYQEIAEILNLSTGTAG